MARCLLPLLPLFPPYIPPPLPPLPSLCAPWPHPSLSAVSLNTDLSAQLCCRHALVQVKTGDYSPPESLQGAQQAAETLTLDE